MNKPLTIKELRALKEGDWVWVVEYERGTYYIIDEPDCILDPIHNYRIYYGPIYGRAHAYGKVWVAYKNKEQAEAM